MMLACERGSGSLLGLAVAGSIVTVLSLALPLYMALATRQSLEDTADAAALGGADVASGIAPGSPCAIASRIATANAASLTSCEVDGLVVTVRVDGTVLALSLTAMATAGPPVVVMN